MSRGILAIATAVALCASTGIAFADQGGAFASSGDELWLPAWATGQ
jgi:hypothetical protein